MANTYSFTLKDVGEITVRRSPRAKNIIMRISASGRPVITIPRYAPYYLARNFAVLHKDWFKQHIEESPQIKDGQEIGASHHVEFKLTQTDKPSSRVTTDTIIIQVPATVSITSEAVQAEARKACTRALKRQAEEILPSYLHDLAQQHGYNYKSVQIKTMTTRWGSCSTKGLINLSIWLMQLRDPLIEYVLCHELAHLTHPHHQKDFWEALSQMIPDYQQRRKELKAKSPRLLIEA